LEGERALKENDFVSILIPKKLYQKIGQEIRNTNPQVVSKYITYILEKKLSSEEKKVYSEEEKEKMKERLRKLGYF
jgi:vacuolar-type H+-ATPase subunit F/Vma7